MCRLFALAAAEPVHAAFWLLEAPDSLAEQSRRNPDGYGLATFGPDGPRVYKEPVAAYADADFRREAREDVSRTFLAHVRYASVGAHRLENTHPFTQDGRVFAHNGHIGGLDALDAHLGSDRALVRGDTDSERFFALITRETRRAGGDLHAGITGAVEWIAEHLPMFSLNLVLATPDELWALRYPDTNELWLLERRAGGPHGCHHLHESSEVGTLRVRSDDLAACDSVVVASEPMDEHPGWRLLESGELVRVTPDLRCASTMLSVQPVHQLTEEDLSERAAASQRAEREAATPMG
jgi:glutamine amidotransferase